VTFYVGIIKSFFFFFFFCGSSLTTSRSQRFYQGVTQQQDSPFNISNFAFNWKPFEQMYFVCTTSITMSSPIKYLIGRDNVKEINKMLFN